MLSWWYNFSFVEQVKLATIEGEMPCISRGCFHATSCLSPTLTSIVKVVLGRNSSLSKRLMGLFKNGSNSRYLNDDVQYCRE